MNTATRPLSANLLHSAFFAGAAERTGRPALLWGDTDGMTHDELARRALGVAGALRRHGVGPGSYVAVVAPKGPEQIAAVLGVLAAGAAYVPIGVDQPTERRTRILELSGARVILDGSGSLDPAGTVAQVLSIDEAMLAAPLDAPVDVGPGATAYTIFTSGSTGLPKGVEVSHRAAVNTVEDVNERFDVGPATVFSRCPPWTSTCRSGTSSGSSGRAAPPSWSRSPAGATPTSGSPCAGGTG